VSHVSEVTSFVRRISVINDDVGEAVKQEEAE
jgi:hypothetical protein